jgi:shikimate kinase
MKIFLIGMPGAGKSTIGKKLSAKLMLPFVDLDKEIEKAEAQSVEDIFREKGEESFREIEAEKLRKTTTEQHSFIMATGGGTPCFHESIHFMKENGLVIFIDMPVDVLYNRVKNSPGRPLLALETPEGIKSRLQSLRDLRIDTYTQAHLTFAENNLSEDSLAHAIVAFKKGNQQ